MIRRIRKIARSDYLLRRACLSVRPSVNPRRTTRLPPNGFPCNLIFEDFSNIRREKSSSLSYKNNRYFI
jgi:hypothetical protein